MNPDFKVRVGEFEGPLTLLLDLIEKRKLHISDVSLSAVADEFITEICLRNATLRMVPVGKNIRYCIYPEFKPMALFWIC